MLTYKMTCIYKQYSLVKCYPVKLFLWIGSLFLLFGNESERKEENMCRWNLLCSEHFK